MKKVMLLAAMLAMVLAAAVPALAQTVTQVGDGNIACVQNAAQQVVVGNNSPQGNGNVQGSQYGDNGIASAIGNESIQGIAQECNIAVTEVNTVVNEYLTINEAGDIVIIDYASASATASASAAVEHEYSAPAAVEHEYSAPAVQYQYSSASASPAAELPETGGSSLIALGAGVLLVAGGLLARRIVR